MKLSEKHKIKLPVRYDEHGQMIWGADDSRILDLRGWGGLTGVGGHNLPEDEAAKIQDQRGQRLMEIINEHYNVPIKN